MNCFLKRSCFCVAIIALTSILYGACGGGGGAAWPQLDTAGTIKSLSQMEGLRVDQLEYFVEDGVTNPDIEVWIMDSQSSELLLCASSSTGMDSVVTEAIYYGGLDASFETMTSDSSYEGGLFKIGVYHNKGESCVWDPTSNLFDDEEKQVGMSAIVSYDRMISEPIFDINYNYVLRLRANSEATFPMPQVITDLIPANNLQIDQAYFISSASSGDGDGTFDTGIYIIDEETDEMIGCSGRDDGMGSVTKAGIPYSKLFADLQDSDGALIDYSDYVGKTVTIYMFDLDSSGCPSDYSDEDDLIAHQENVSWDDLPGAKITMIDGESYIIFNMVSE